MGFRHIYFKEDVCTGCNLCVDVCMCDALVPNPVKGKPPVEMYPEECWFCGCCMTFCPQLEKGAIQIVTPFPMRGGFRSTPLNSSPQRREGRREGRRKK
jgi:formate hydrogenlyase subunit 6/NADH:ubiquinone oxidoreductase subunit I